MGQKLTVREKPFLLQIHKQEKLEWRMRNHSWPESSFFSFNSAHSPTSNYIYKFRDIQKLYSRFYCKSIGLFTGKRKKVFPTFFFFLSSLFFFHFIFLRSRNLFFQEDEKEKGKKKGGQGQKKKKDFFPSCYHIFVFRLRHKLSYVKTGYMETGRNDCYVFFLALTS